MWKSRLQTRPAFAALAAFCLLVAPVQGLAHSHAHALEKGPPSFETSVSGSSNELPDSSECALCIQGHRNEQNLIPSGLAKVPSANSLHSALHPEPALHEAKNLALPEAARAPPANV